MTTRTAEVSEEARYSIRTVESPGAPCVACGEPDTGAGAVGHRGDEPVCGVCLLQESAELGLLLALAAVTRAYASADSATPEASRAALEELGAFARVYDLVAGKWGPPGPYRFPGFSDREEPVSGARRDDTRAD